MRPPAICGLVLSPTALAVGELTLGIFIPIPIPTLTPAPPLALPVRLCLVLLLLPLKAFVLLTLLLNPEVDEIELFVE